MNMTLRSILAAAAIAAAVHAFTMGVLCDVLPREATPPLLHVSRDLHFPEGNFLRLAHSDGSVVVRTHEKPDFEIRAEIRAYGDAALRSEVAEYAETMVQGTADGGGIRIQTESGERPDPVEFRIDYQLTVPRNANVSVEGANGNVLIHEGCGALFVQGNNTDIKILGPGGAVRAESNNGRIVVKDAPGETVLKTINGSVYASMAGGYLEASTTNGEVAVVLLTPDVASCNLTSQNGGIKLMVSDPGDLALRAATDSGTIYCGIDLAYDPGFPKRRTLEGRSGSGSNPVSLYSRNGDIRIVRNAP